MEPRAGLEALARNLDAAQKLLRENADAYPALNAASQALRRVSRNANRPIRLAILGESNSGKSSIANFIAGEIALPALPIANTRLPTLLHYAPVPFIEALHESGERFALAPGDKVALHNIVRLEVGLPSEPLRTVEILDFPGSANPLFQTDLLGVLRHRIDAAIWTTVATQAWRETERQAWSRLPQRIRRFGLLAVTHCDLISGEEDMRRLRARLQTVASEHFHAICFVAPPASHGMGTPEPESAAGAAADLFSKAGRLIWQFETERLDKAVVITRRVAEKALARLERD
jgi:hypothetical protein